MHYTVKYSSCNLFLYKNVQEFYIKQILIGVHRLSHLLLWMSDMLHFLSLGEISM